MSDTAAAENPTLSRRVAHVERSAAVTYAVQPSTGVTYVWAWLLFEVQSLAVLGVHRRNWWTHQPGVYIFAMETAEYLAPLYVGRTRSLKNRLPYHKTWDTALAHGATHLHTRVVLDWADRTKIERSLIAVFQPHLNKHYRRLRISERDRSFCVERGSHDGDTVNRYLASQGLSLLTASA
jgi:hypothetical protein